MAYVENAIILADHDRQIRIVIEPGYTDDQDRLSLRIMVEVKEESGEMRLPYGHIRPLCQKLISFALGREVKLYTGRRK